MMTNQKTIDTPSLKGLFGWERINQEDALPVIVRENQVRYCPVRIVEQEIIKKYHALPQSVFQCITLKSFYLTPTEAKLLNNINFNHCNNRYGDAFFGSKDLLVSIDSVHQLAKYLKVTQDIFNLNSASKYSQLLGIVRITIDPQNTSSTMLVPYITKALTEPDMTTKHLRFVPLKLVEPFDFHLGTSVRAEPNDWDIMYLKMLAVCCRNDSQNSITKENQILSLDGLVYRRTNTPLIQEDYLPQNWQA